jgi:hypothetical protein
MPFVYNLALATSGNLTTSGSTNTEVDAFFVKAGSSRAVFLRAINMLGKGAGLTALSSIVMRIIKLATASTAGTAITPSPTDGARAAAHTSASRPTIGSTRTNHMSIGCGAASPGAWSALDQEGAIGLDAGAAGSIDGVDACGTASMTYEFSAQTFE